jgi:DNA-binding winged helix-turn-helix (wHTH) protein/tetratricopeptide (TPR) repeat protein
MNLYGVGPFHLNADRLTLYYQGRAVSLGPRVVETLLALVEAAGHVVSKDALLDRVWPEGFVEEANLAQNVYVLRKTFRAYGCADCIETVPREGYRFTGAARRTTDGVSSRRLTRPLLAKVVMSAVAMLTIVALFVLTGYGNGSRTVASHRLSVSGERLYQIGMYYWNLRTYDGVEKSILYFTRLVDSDPNDSRGYAALADANITMGDYCYGTHRPQLYFARAQAYIAKALTLDPSSAQAHAALGFLALHRNNSAIAMTELRRAIALDRTYAPAHEWIAIALLREGRLVEGRYQLRVALGLDPLSVSTQAWLGSVAYADGRFSDAILYSRQALELAPTRADALTTIGEAYEARGDVERAIATFKRYGDENPYYLPQAAALLAPAYTAAHRMPEARAALAYASAHANHVDSAYLAVAMAAVQGTKVTPQLLERARGHASSLAIENAARFNVFRNNG